MRLFASTQLNTFLPWVLRLLLGGIFIWSGLAKVANLGLFYESAQNYHVLPPVITHFYSVVLPWAEILAGFYLLFGLFTRFAAILSGLLLLSFFIAISVALSQGESPDCGCFLGGMHFSPVTPALLWRDGALLLASIYLIICPTSQFSLDAWLLHQQEAA